MTRMPIDLISSLTTRSCARNSPMQTSAAGEAAPPSSVVKLSNGAGTFSPLRPTARPATGAISSGLRSTATMTRAPVDQKLSPFCRSNLDDDDRKEEQHAGGEKGCDDRCRCAFRPEHQKAHRYPHEADIAVAGVQALDTGIGDARVRGSG